MGATKIIKELLLLDETNAKLIVDSIKSLERKTRNEVHNKKELNIVLAVTALAKSSVRYWDKEQKKGLESLWTKVIGPIPKIPWKDDVRGFVNGLGHVGGVSLIVSMEPTQTIAVGWSVACGAVKSYQEYANNAKALKEAKKKQSENNLANLRERAKGKPRRNLNTK